MGRGPRYRVPFRRRRERRTDFRKRKANEIFRCLGYSDYFLLRNTGRFLRRVEDFYTENLKNRIKQIRPLMKAWYRIKQSER